MDNLTNEKECNCDQSIALKEKVAELEAKIKEKVVQRNLELAESRRMAGDLLLYMQIEAI